jgi:Uma2 family endonuclease
MRLYEQLPSLEHYVLIHQDIICMEVHTRHNEVDWLEQVETGPDAKLELPAIGVTLALLDVYENAIPNFGTMDA